MANYFLADLFVNGRHKNTPQPEKYRREVTGYGEYPGLTVTPFMSTPGDMNATVTDYLTTLSHSHVIVPVTVEASTTVSSSVGANVTQLVNSTTLSATATVSMSSGIPNATVTYTGSPSKHSYPAKTTLSEITGRPTSWYFGNSTSSSQYAGTGVGTGSFTAASVSDVTVTVTPIPVLTTGATAAMNISGSSSSSSSCSHSDISTSVHNTTSTRPTVYQTVTETWTSDNCTLDASKTSSVSKDMSSTVTTTAGYVTLFPPLLGLKLIYLLQYRCYVCKHLGSTRVEHPGCGYPGLSVTLKLF